MMDTFPTVAPYEVGNILLLLDSNRVGRSPPFLVHNMSTPLLSNSCYMGGAWNVVQIRGARSIGGNDRGGANQMERQDENDLDI